MSDLKELYWQMAHTVVDSWERKWQLSLPIDQSADLTAGVAYAFEEFHKAQLEATKRHFSLHPLTDAYAQRGWFTQCSCAGQGGLVPHDPSCCASPEYDFGKSALPSGHVSADPLYCTCGKLISSIGMPYYFDGTIPVCAVCFYKKAEV